MVEATIERLQTPTEKADFVLLGTSTVYDKFNERLAKVTLEFNKQFKPFDSQCARLDFKDKLEAAEKESQRIYGFVNQNLKIDFGDLSKYGNEDRFELLEDQEDREEILVNGVRTHVVTGHTLSYRCKPRGHGIAVFIPIKEYEEKFAKKK